MEALRIALLVCHLGALATLLGAFVARFAAERDVGRVLAGAAGALLATGVLLVVVRQAADLGNNGPKIAVKLAVAAAVLGAALLAGRRTGAFYATGLLAVANVAVAVAWT
jgi:hypothetical protein